MISSALLLFTLNFAHAAPETLKLSGLHCDSCRQTIQKTACEGKEKFAKCEVKWTNEENQEAELLIDTKPGQKLDTAGLVQKIEGLGYKAAPADSSAATPAKKATTKK